MCNTVPANNFNRYSDRVDPRVITIINILFLSGGVLLLAGGLYLAAGRSSRPGTALLAFGVFPVLLLAAAFLASSASVEAAERFLAVPANVLLVGAGYCLLTAPVLLLLRRRAGGNIPDRREGRPCRSVRSLCLPILISVLAVALQTLFPTASETRVIFALLLGAAALASLRALENVSNPAAFLLACLPYLAFGTAWILSPEMVEGDSAWLQYPTFEFVARSFAGGRFLPPWLPQSSGIRIGLLNINVPFDLPHKAFTYFLYSLFPLPLPTVYKLQYLLGVMTFSLGWWLVLLRITRNRPAAYFGLLMITLAGTGITFHQEQVVATAYLLPWFILALMSTEKHPLWLIPAAVIFGLGLAFHYPQIQAASFALVALTLALAGFWHPVRAMNAGKRYLLPALALAFIATGPALYVWSQSPRMASGLRGMDIDDRPRDFGEYLHLQRGASSASPVYYYQYFAPRWEKAGGEMPPIDVRDRCAFFVGRAGLILAVTGLILGLPKTGAAGVLVVIFSLLSIGINSPVPFPRYFFQLRLPFFDVFRQWVHFFPMINYSLSLLAAVGVSRLTKIGGRTFRRVSIVVISAAIFLQVYDSAIYGLRYLAFFPGQELPGDLREQFFQADEISATSLFQYRERFHLNLICGELAIPEKAFIARNILNLEPGQVFRPDLVCRHLAGNPGISAVIKIPEEQFPLGISGYGEVPEIIELRAGFSGAGGAFAAGRPGLVVTPLNRGLEPRALLNGRKVPVWTVNAALTGVPVPEGEHRLELTVNHDLYLVFFLLQWMIFLSLATAFLNIKEF